jgi:hypothetical protein
MRKGDPLRWLIGGWQKIPDEIRVHMRTILIKDNWMVKSDGSMIKAIFVNPKNPIDDGLYVIESQGRHRWLHKATEEMDLWPKWTAAIGKKADYDFFEWNMTTEDIDMIGVYFNHFMATKHEKYPFVHPRLLKTAFTPNWYPSELWTPKIDPLFSTKDFKNPYIFLGRQPMRMVIIMPMRHALIEEMRQFKEADHVEDLLFGDPEVGRKNLIAES